jgi:hypothetical protein
MTMSTNVDQLVSEDAIRAMLRRHEGPPAPIRHAPDSGRRATRRRATILVIAILSVVAVAGIAGAATGNLPFGTSASPQIIDKVANGEIGAPPNLDPKIESAKTVSVMRINTEDGPVVLYAAPAARATLCFGIDLTWLDATAAKDSGGPNMGCNGPGGKPEPVSIALEAPNGLANGPVLLYGAVPSASASIVVSFQDGSSDQFPTTSGFYLFELTTAQRTSGHRPIGISARDSNGKELASSTLSKTIFEPIGMPSPG